MKHLINSLPISLFIGLAGFIAGKTVDEGTLPQDPEHLAIYLSVAIMGLLAWVVQRVVEQQNRTAEILENHLGEIGNSLTSLNEQMRPTIVVGNTLEKYMATTSVILAGIQKSIDDHDTAEREFWTWIVHQPVKQAKPKPRFLDRDEG